MAGWQMILFEHEQEDVKGVCTGAMDSGYYTDLLVILLKILKISQLLMIQPLIMLQQQPKHLREEAEISEMRTYF